jgi:hypothetical protein
MIDIEPMKPECSGPGQDEEPCDRPHFSAGLCSGHYMQRQRDPDKPLRPLRTARGEGTQLTISMPASLREAAKGDAERRNETEGEWWRNAALERLDRKKR